MTDLLAMFTSLIFTSLTFATFKGLVFTMILENIELITFDVFGTILDWRALIDRLAPGRFPEFLGKCETIQRGPAPLFPYRALVEQVLLDMEAGSPEAVRTVSQRFGTATPFKDFGALTLMRDRFFVGCLSNSDHVHQGDAQRSLGFPWDITIVAEDLQAYKPAQSVWERAAHAIQRELGVKKSAWLHVSAFEDYDLKPAHEAGIKTCFLPRPGGTPASALETSTWMVASDLYDVANQLFANCGEPVTYDVTVEIHDETTASRFIAWIRYEHGADLLAIRGCHRFQITSELRTEGNVVVKCQYVFKTAHHLEHYLTHHAPKLRQHSLELFAEDNLKYSRGRGTLQAMVHNRQPGGF